MGKKQYLKMLEMLKMSKIWWKTQTYKSKEPTQLKQKINKISHIWVLHRKSAKSQRKKKILKAAKEK